MGQKISALSAAAALTGTEEVPVNQSGATKKTTVQAIANLAGGGTSIGLVVMLSSGQVTL